MTQLLICRHSKAEASRPAQSDRDRELTPAGKKDAEAVGEEIARRGMNPDLILASESTRTRQTTALIVERLSSTPEIAFLPELYSASAGDTLDVIATHAATAASILVVAHNPGLEELVSRMAGEDVRLRTSTVAVLETDPVLATENDPLRGLHLTEVFGPRVT